MKTKLLVSSFLTACISTYAYAGHIYIGPMVSLEDINGKNNNYIDLQPKLSFGYGAMPDGIYWAGEVFYIPTTLSISNKRSNGRPSAKAGQSYGMSFMSGYMVNDCILGYLSIGVISTEFPNPEARKSGGQLGLGILTAISHNYNFRAEYNYTAYHSIHGMGSLKSNAIGVGFIYKFDN